MGRFLDHAAPPPSAPPARRTATRGPRRSAEPLRDRAGGGRSIPATRHACTIREVSDLNQQRGPGSDALLAAGEKSASPAGAPAAGDDGAADEAAGAGSR